MSDRIRDLQEVAGSGRMPGAMRVSSLWNWAWRDPDTRVLLAILLVVLAMRLFSLGSYPLMDTSEARYGEIARVMLVTGNYVTPQEVPGVPFWAKPPLYAWMSAGSIAVFGVNEFALRLPSFLCGLGVLGLCFVWARRLVPLRAPAEQVRVALLACTILATCTLFFVSAGAVMTDPGLALCSTAMLACFHLAVIDAGESEANDGAATFARSRVRRQLARYGFFAAAGLGMLAKGPVVFLYAGVPIAIWIAWQRQWRETWERLPWISGTLLAAVICVPWYLMAEQRTPGFLKYFLLGEHILRFLEPGWTGDKYGTAHAEPLGTIWLNFLESLGVLAVLLLAASVSLARQNQRGSAGTPVFGPAHRLLLLAALVPLVFFTFAGNIIWTYVLPALGPVALLLAEVCNSWFRRATVWRLGLRVVLLAAAASLAIAAFAWAPHHAASHSSAALVAQWRERQASAPGELVYVGRRIPASLRFYSRGEAIAVADVDLSLAGVARDGDRYVVIAPTEVGSVQDRATALHLSSLLLSGNNDLALVWVHAESASRLR